MVREIGVKDVGELFADIPVESRLNRRLNLPEAVSEPELISLMKELSASCASAEQYSYFLGAGCYNHYIPGIIDHILTRSEFYTAYTPYQPEISQGTLQAMFEFQTLVCQLTGMEAANSSMYDCGTALAEAAIMATRVLRKRATVVVSSSVHPEYRAILKAYLGRLGLKVKEFGFNESGRADVASFEDSLDDDVAAVIVQSPNFFGVIEDLAELSDATSSVGALLIDVVSDPISLGILKPPGELGADIVVGQGQSLGIPMSFGGPHLGLFACREKFVRQMPGRLAGRTADHNGRPGFVMTLATREQHIRRGRATSNICTNHQLMALAAAVYMTTMGKAGMRDVAELNLLKTDYAKNRLLDMGAQLVFSGPVFNEFVVKTARPVKAVNESLREQGIIGGLGLDRFYEQFDDRTMLACCTEGVSRDAIDIFCEEVTRR
ncbi:MAG: aminomethyl-transferring glycine dehydrogenase subunit GcvPA [Candidatus Coatesbacteria bacterium]|nr:MAG: aminomethyl-transferring glycine dehydrogenase subunit GcvPA [Candidatus Coatesbacteria bacterium]